MFSLRNCRATAQENSNFSDNPCGSFCPSCKKGQTWAQSQHKGRSYCFTQFMKGTFLNSSVVAIHLFHRQPQLAQRLFPPTVFPSIARTGAENVFWLLIVKTKQDKNIGVEQLIKSWETRSTYRFRTWTLLLLLSPSKQNHSNFFQQCIFNQHQTSWEQKKSPKQGCTGEKQTFFS